MSLANMMAAGPLFQTKLSCARRSPVAAAVGSRGWLNATTVWPRDNKPSSMKPKGSLRTRLQVTSVQEEAPSYLTKETKDTGMYEKDSGHRKVAVVLGPYKNKEIKVKVAKIEVTDQQVMEAFNTKSSKTYELERVNFTGSGAKKGHTVVINFEGKYADGPQAGQGIKGTQANMYELELVDREDQPWKAFVENIVKNGMGQEESKTFEMTFPADFKAPSLQNVKARFTVTVKAIAVKKQLPADNRSKEEKMAEIRASLQGDADRKMNESANAAIREAIMLTSTADTKKVADNVSWAKFGEKSLAEFSWNLIMEEIAHQADIPFEEVKPFLRREADIEWA